MPPRWISLGIIAFWLATTGWLFWKDLWPQWQPGQPPALVPDLIEEARTERPPILWTVFHNGQKTFQGKTQIRHPQRDVYEFLATYTPTIGKKTASIEGWKIRRLQSMYRVNEQGHLLALGVTVEGMPPLPALAGLFAKLPDNCIIDIKGKVEHNRFAPRINLTVPGLGERQFSLPSVEVSQRGSVLLPLHPVHRIRGLSPGQRWRIPVIDPLHDSLTPLKGLDSGPRFLSARVEQDVEYIYVNRRKDVPCLVITYEGEDMSARTLVEHPSGIVLRQEATLGKEHWVMQRD